MALFAKKSKSTDEAAPVSMPMAPGASGATSPPADMPDIRPIPDAFPGDAAPAKKGGRRKKGASNNVVRSAPRGIKGGVVVGLNIGNDTIKAVEVRGRGSEAVVTAVGMIATPTESLSNGIVMSPGALSSSIRQLFAQSGIRTRNVISSVSGGSALVVRVLEVPKMSDSELADNMNMDLERYVPFPPTDVVKDFRALRELPSDPDAPNMEVLLAAAQGETIDLHLKVLQGAKLTPQAIDVEPLASARALFYGSQNNNGVANGNSNGGALMPNVAGDYNDATALINIGATSTEISVLRGDVLVFTRSVPNGGNALTQAIADHLGLAWPDAERMKREMGDALPPHNPNAAVATTSDEDDWSAFGDPDDASANTVQTTPVQTTTVQTVSMPANDVNAVVAPPMAEDEADPFDMDIFNKGPRTDDPQEGHRQKQDDKTPFNFDLSRFNFSEEEAEVDDDIPTHPVEADDNPATPLTQTSTRIVASDAPAAPASAVSPANADAQNPNVLPTFAAPGQESATASSDQVLPTLNFSMAGEDEELSSMAPSGQMYGVGSVDDPELPSFPSLPQGSALPDGLLAPGVESYSDGAEDILPSMADEGVVVPAVQASAPSVSPVVTASAISQEGLIPEIATSSVITPGAATATGAPMFDFSAPIVTEGSGQAGGGDDFDSAFADMIAIPATTPPVSVVKSTDAAPPVSQPVEAVPGAVAPVATPGSPSSPYAVDPAVTAGTSDFDLDEFATQTSTDDSFRMEDFGLGVGDGGDTTPASVYGILQPQLGELVNEVRRSLEYYASRYPDAGVQRIVLIGGGARLPNMDVLLTQEIGVPSMVHNPLAHVALQAKGLPNGFVDQNGSAFAVALGLALRDLVG